MPSAAEIEIAAPPETVWAVLADTDNHPSFDPGIARIFGGPAEEGQRLLVYTMEDGDRGRVMRVTSFSPPRLMVWTERAPFGLIRVDRTFTLTPIGRGATHFRLDQDASGRLVRLARRSEVDLTEAFERFCAGLKLMAETRDEVARERRR